MAVQPVVALPGWFVRGTGADGMPVLAAGQVEAYFASRPRNPSMTPQFIQQIVHQLDQKCRDVAPRSYPRNQNGASFEPAGS
jgi:hypothetical protein